MSFTQKHRDQIHFSTSRGWGMWCLRWMRKLTWWRHQMETFSSLLAICSENSLVTGESPSQRPATRSFDVFFDMHLSKRLSKQSWARWFETPSSPIWRHWNGPMLCFASLRYIQCRGDIRTPYKHSQCFRCCSFNATGNLCISIFSWISHFCMHTTDSFRLK